jgi:hypothetical protein
LGNLAARVQFHDRATWSLVIIHSLVTETSLLQVRSKLRRRQKNMSSPVDSETTLDTMTVMRRQEECAYQVTDYLSELPAGPLHLAEAPVDAECRQIMAKWSIDICDFCHYRRETAAISLNCLDRFMATPDGKQVLMDLSQYQLAAMTALYSSVKIHEHEAMDPALVSNLSRGVHSAEAVERMEQRLLTAIQWRVNPPTAFAFVRAMFNLIPDHLMGASVRETVMELTNFQIELATCDYKFSQQSASRIAFASAMNAVESLTTDSTFLENFESTMSRAMQLEIFQVRDIRVALYEAVNGSEPMEICLPLTGAKNVEQTTRVGGYTASPRSVNI